jgi:hypothetical protein
MRRGEDEQVGAELGQGVHEHAVVAHRHADHAET